MISYGVIIRLLEDDDEALMKLEEALWEVYEEAKAFNPDIIF